MIGQFVYIIESPSPKDFLNGKTEGQALTQMLDIAGIPQTYRVATNLAMFREAMDVKLGEALKHHHKYPILHLSMHGNQTGVGFTSGELLTWHQLQENLQPLISAMTGSLIICMSSCFGSFGNQMAMYDDDAPTFYALIGNENTIPVFDAALSYSSFYRLLFGGHTVDICMQGMRGATQNDNFLINDGKVTKQGFKEFLNQQSIERLLKNLGVS